MPSVIAIGGTAKTLPPQRRSACAISVSSASGNTRVRDSRSCSSETGDQRVLGGSLNATCPWKPTPP